MITANSSPRILTLFLAGALSACAGAQEPGRPLPEADIVWPVPPEQPRIRYIGAFRSDLDLGKKTSFFGRVRNAMLGTQEEVLALYQPRDVYVDNAGRTWVTDGPGANRLSIFDAEQKKGRVLITEGAGRLFKPMGMDGDSVGRVYVADAAARRIVAFDAGGGFVRAYGGPSVLLNPVDVAVTPTGDRVYVADSYLHQVIIFDGAGALIRRIGRNVGDLATKTAPRSMGSNGHYAAKEALEGEKPHLDRRDMVENRGLEPGEFRYPAFLALAPDGTLYVSDGLNFRIQAFDRDGRILRQFGGLGDMPGLFARPKGIAVDGEGNVYVVDAAFNNVQVFNPEGQLLLAFGGVGHGDGELWLPLGIDVDRRGRIYVADRFNNRLQIYQYLMGADEPPLVASESQAPEPQQ